MKFLTTFTLALLATMTHAYSQGVTPYTPVPPGQPGPVSPGAPPYLQRSQNLADVPDKAAARANLGATGTVTALSCGAGLTGGTITISGTCGLRDQWSVLDSGAKCDGTTDDTAAIQSAIDLYGGVKILTLPVGTCIALQLSMKANLYFRGAGQFNSFIKSKNAANATLMTSGESTHVNNVVFEDMGFDCNRANNSAGDCVNLYGIRPTFQNVFIRDTADNGLTTNMDPADATTPGGIEGTFVNLIIANSGKSCFYFGGPNDSQFDKLTLIDCSLSLNNGYYGMYATGFGNGRFNNFHHWNYDATTNTPICGAYLDTGGNTFTNSHFEGGNIPLCIAGFGYNTIAASGFYAPRGTFAMTITSSDNLIQGAMGLTYASANPNYKCISLTGAANIIDVIDVGCNNGGIDFTSDPGKNVVRMTGYKNLGTTNYVGTPALSSSVLINTTGPAGAQLDQKPSIAWTSYTPTVSCGAGTLTTSSASGSYQRSGRTVSFTITINITTNGTCATSLIATLPTQSGSSAVFSGRETGVSSKALQGYSISSTTATILNYDGTYPGANGAVVVITGSYPANS